MQWLFAFLAVFFIVAKLAVTGQRNALGQTETDLEAGDRIYVRMDVLARTRLTFIAIHSQLG